MFCHDAWSAGPEKRFSLTACDISMGIEALSRVVLSSSAGAGGKPPKLLIMSPVQVGEIAGSPMENWFPAEGTRERSAQLPELYKAIAEKYGADFWRHRPWQQQRRMPSILTTALMRLLHVQWRTK